MFQLNAPFVYYIHRRNAMNIINKWCIKLEHEIKELYKTTSAQQ